MQDKNKQKAFAALISVFSNTFLIFAKFIVGFLTHSMGIIAEAIHSFSDLLASLMAFYSVKKSAEPADDTHHFGHGKFEDLSALIEGLLILFASIFIVFESVSKLKSGHFEIINTEYAIFVIILSIIINIFVSKHLYKVATLTDSLALIADAKHLSTDVYSSIGILVALIIIQVTGWHIIDPIIAIFVAMVIFKTGIEICKKASHNLLDTSLPQEEQIIIEQIVKSFLGKGILEVRTFRTRKAGAQKIIDLILSVQADMTIKEGHKICDEIEESLEKNLGNTFVNIHLEPFED